MLAQPFIGIDFGTCNCSVAWFNPKSTQAELLLNAEGDDKTPSVVYFGASEILVGRYAEEGLQSPEDRKRILTAVKRDLARDRVWILGQHRVTPVAAAAEILKKLKRDAEDGQFHEPVPRAVITCPAAFDETEKDKLKEAATLAGFQEVELLEEPVAAAMAYARAGVQVGRYVLVYDLGGGTFDLALLVREDGDDTFRLAMQPRGERIGGEDFDRAIYDYCDRRMQGMKSFPACAAGVDLHFLRECRKCKESLSASERPYTFSAWPLDCGQKLELNRPGFEELIGAHVERTVELTGAVRADAAAAGFDVDTVILIGGSSRIPLIMRRLHETLDVEPRKWQKQDVAVALGAAYHAHARWGIKPRDERSEPRGHPPPAQESRDLLARAQAAFDKAEPLIQAGSEREARQTLEDALHCAQSACDLEPQWGEAFFLKGRVLQTREEWPLAIVAFSAAIQLQADAAAAHRQRGLCRLMSGDNAGANADFAEVIRGTPTEPDYRSRAVAHLRLGDPAAAVADLQQGLSLAERATPRAALLAVRGMILRDKLASPADAIAAFAEALQSLARPEDLAGIPLFSPICELFGFGEPLKPEKSVDRRDAALPIIGAVQRALWQTCKSAGGGCTRPTVVEFFAHNAHEIAPSLWTADPDLAFHAASIGAEHNDVEKVGMWLERLLDANPAFDIQRAQEDPCISKWDNALLRARLTPRLVAHEQHGLLFNHLTVTNRSPFRVSAVKVAVSIQRSDGKTDPPVIQHLAALAAGASHRWSNFFKGAVLFGSNIKKVDVTLTCAEARPPFAAAPPQSPPVPTQDPQEPPPKPMPPPRRPRRKKEPPPIPPHAPAKETVPVLDMEELVPTAENTIPLLDMVELVPPEKPPVPVPKPAPRKIPVLKPARAMPPPIPEIPVLMPAEPTILDMLPETIAKRCWLIGRGDQCDLAVPESSVSTRHCRLTESDGKFFVEDLGSFNGTYVNGQRIAGPTRITPNDRVTLGIAVPMPWPPLSLPHPKSRT